MTRRTALFLSALAPIARSGLAFQGNAPRNRVSPHETVSADVGGDKITISYGRPYLKGRKVGNEVAPYGQVWRLGADEATKITVTRSTTIEGGPVLSPGSYSLFAIPGPDKWTLIVNKVADQWGAFKYDQSQDLGRFDLNVQHPSSPAEQFTITLTTASNNTAKLTLAWGDASVSTTLRAS